MTVSVSQFRPTQRVVTRVIMTFLLRVAKGLAAPFAGDLKSGLLFLALAHPGPRESDVVRPVSVAALAATLKINDETARRNIASLAELGFCERVEGRWAASRSAAAVAIREDQQNLLARCMVRMLSELEALGFDFGNLDQSAWPDVAGNAQGAAAATSSGSAIAESQIARIATELVLRFVEEGDEYRRGSLERGFVFVALLVANTEEITYDRRIAWSYPSMETPPPDEIRRPVKIAELSQILGMPYETTRRYVHEMVRDGHCVSIARKGFIVPIALLQSATNLKINSLFAMRFAQAIGELRRAGFDFSQIAAIASEYLESERAR